MFSYYITGNQKHWILREQWRYNNNSTHLLFDDCIIINIKNAVMLVILNDLQFFNNTEWFAVFQW